MPKMTKKYKAALAAAKNIATVAVNDSQVLYQQLNAQNWYWNSKWGIWEMGEPAQKPSDLVRIRVWAATEKVEQAAEEVTHLLQKQDYELLECSTPYVCRPPRQLESRIYLSFLPRRR
jgi:predicted CoA-binding protein